MIAIAAHTPETRLIEGRPANLQRGELVGSLRYLGRRWSWSKSKVERFLSSLRIAGRIRDRDGTGFVVISLCNYDTYNPARDGNGTGSDPPTGTVSGRLRDKAEEGDKNLRTEELSLGVVPNKRGFVKPSREELNFQAEKIGLPSQQVDQFVNHYESNGWKVGPNPMKSWIHALTNWKIRWEERRHEPTSTTRQPNTAQRVDRNAGTTNAGRAAMYANVGKKVQLPNPE